jgi:hypothetical protein
MKLVIIGYWRDGTPIIRRDIQREDAMDRVTRSRPPNTARLLEKIRCHHLNQPLVRK